MQVVRLTPINVPPNFDAFRRRKDLIESMLEDGQEPPSPTYDFVAELRHPLIRYIGIVEDNTLFGFFKFQRFGALLWDVHMALDYDLRNRIGLDCARQALALMWDDFPNARVIGMGAGSNRQSLYFGFALGFRPVGKIPNAWAKGGRLWPRYVLTIEPPAKIKETSVA